MEKLSLDVADILRNKAQYHPKIVEEVLKGALWWSADYTGKGLKCQFRSETAHNRILRHAIKDIKGQEFVHEHIVPKTLILEELLKLNTGCNLDTLAIDVERLLNLSIYCLIDIQGNSPDKEIDKNGMRQKMPNSAWADINAKPEDIWGRYEKIKVIRLP